MYRLGTLSSSFSLDKPMLEVIPQNPQIIGSAVVAQTEIPRISDIKNRHRDIQQGATFVYGGHRCIDGD
jgi:hypothetical protein